MQEPKPVGRALEENRQSDEGWNVYANPASWSNTRVC